MKLKAKIWLEKDGTPLLGEGRAKLLQTIDEEHSIHRAAEKLGMSYRHAWGEDVVHSTRGGKNGGKTELTTSGRALLDEYHEKIAILERFLV